MKAAVHLLPAFSLFTSALLLGCIDSPAGDGSGVVPPPNGTNAEAEWVTGEKNLTVSVASAAGSSSRVGTDNDNCLPIYNFTLPNVKMVVANASFQGTLDYTQSWTLGYFIPGKPPRDTVSGTLPLTIEFDLRNTTSNFDEGDSIAIYVVPEGDVANVSLSQRVQLEVALLVDKPEMVIFGENQIYCA